MNENQRPAGRVPDAVHAVGLLHRDIKAPNVVREDGGRPVLMDFGSVVEHEGGTGGPGLFPGAVAYDWTADERNLLVAVSHTRTRTTLELFDVTTDERQVLRSFDRPFAAPRLSPDGRFVTYTPMQADSENGDIFVLDSRTGDGRPLIEHPDDDSSAVWAPAGDALVFASDRDGQPRRPPDRVYGR